MHIRDWRASRASRALFWAAACFALLMAVLPYPPPVPGQPNDKVQHMRSLDKLRQRNDRIYYPAHGPAVTKPQQYVRHLVGHRMQREKQILGLVGGDPLSIPEIVANAYPGLDPRLTAAAGGSVYAHLLDLERRGLVEQHQDRWKTA